MVASSSLDEGGSASFHCKLIYHGWMINMGGLPFFEEKWRRRNGCGGVGERLGGEEGGENVVRV